MSYGMLASLSRLRSQLAAAIEKDVVCKGYVAQWARMPQASRCSCSQQWRASRHPAQARCHWAATTKDDAADPAIFKILTGCTCPTRVTGSSPTNQQIHVVSNTEVEVIGKSSLWNFELSGSSWPHHGSTMPVTGRDFKLLLCRRVPHDWSRELPVDESQTL
jgi:hypothetical protein